MCTELREFLVFEAQQHYMDASSLRKIEKTTGMTLVHVRSYNGVAELWFSRRRRTIKVTDAAHKKNNTNIEIKP